MYVSRALKKKGAGVLPKPFAQAAGLAIEMNGFSVPDWRVRHLDGVKGVVHVKS